MQVGWLYERPVDLDGLTRFHANLANGLLGRRIERSPLPFGRHRWVWDAQPSTLDITTETRPRAELGDWFDERTQLPIDPESGPAWRLSVVPLNDGATAISLVLSHYVIDGIGGAVAVTEAILGMTRELGYPRPRARTRVRGVVQDARETLREAPAVARAFVAAVKEARRRRTDQDRPATPRQNVTYVADVDTPVTAPSVWIRIELDQWNTRAATLSGTGSTLAAAFTAQLDRNMGRRHGHAEGIPTLLTVNDRTTADDARAVAVSFTRVGVDPAELTTDLSAARGAIKDALVRFKESEDATAQLVPLTPFTPKRGWQQLIEYALTDPEQPAVCSNLGDTGPAAIRPDGTLCDAAFARGASQHLTQRWLRRIGSQLHVYYGTAMEINQVGIYVCAYHPDSVTSRAQLRELATRTVAEFGLTAAIE
ncbi:hypothetical protein [Mycobacterium sp. MS1601]|uniref:hypothetical protein n=1 Tax=Mycobacterium sp. MS1601 TaxID=1936029 RepID=UPI0012FC2394|nr:hypothetical protein [Mycobacterium sp. MS1601]